MLNRMVNACGHPAYYEHQWEDGCGLPSDFTHGITFQNVRSQPSFQTLTSAMATLNLGGELCTGTPSQKFSGDV